MHKWQVFWRGDRNCCSEIGCRLKNNYFTERAVLILYLVLWRVRRQIAVSRFILLLTMASKDDNSRKPSIERGENNYKNEEHEQVLLSSSRLNQISYRLSAHSAAMDPLWNSIHSAATYPSRDKHSLSERVHRSISSSCQQANRLRIPSWASPFNRRQCHARMSRRCRGITSKIDIFVSGETLRTMFSPFESLETVILHSNKLMEIVWCTDSTSGHSLVALTVKPQQ